jgi:GNAT superfamily N-acetyltransferase
MISYRVSKKLMDSYRAFELTSGLDKFYPDFNNWYWNKVAPSTMVGDSEIILAEEHEQVVGVALIKRGTQPKLRCLRVRPEYANRGIGVHLIDRSLKQLDCDKPMVTVPEEKINELSRIMVNRFSFNLMHVDKGLYRPNMLEYIFNDIADQRVKSEYGEN